MEPLPLMEAFYTIQGEGFHQGEAAFFIRLAGCDVGCHWCDVKESWDKTGYPLKEIKDIIAKGRRYNSNLAVITGGEPLMYDLTDLTRQLKTKGFRTHLETSGAHQLTGTWDWVCLSPKKFKHPIDSIYNKTDELKVIIYNKSDFAWAESFRKKLRLDCVLFLQPEWSRSKKIMPMIVDYVKENPSWKISLQIHKYINVP